MQVRWRWRCAAECSSTRPACALQQPVMTISPAPQVHPCTMYLPATHHVPMSIACT